MSAFNFKYKNDLRLATDLNARVPYVTDAQLMELKSINDFPVVYSDKYITIHVNRLWIDKRTDK